MTNKEDCDVIKHILKTYENATGQMINMEKSCITFTKNIKADERLEFCYVLGISKPLDNEPYLGLPK